jgi:uncharacterized protein
MAEQNIINSTEFARKGLELHGTIAVSQFSRCADLVASQDGNVVWQLSGSMNAEAKPELELKVTGMLQLTCQRCLEPYPFKLDIHSSFVLVANEAALPAEEDDLDDSHDYLVADANMPVAELIEDEVLLALPFAPKHDTQVCGVADNITELKKANLEKPNPFAVLQGFKASKKQI